MKAAGSVRLYISATAPRYAPACWTPNSRGLLLLIIGAMAVIAFGGVNNTPYVSLIG